VCSCRRARGRQSVVPVPVGSSWSWGVEPIASLLFHKVRAMKRIRGGLLKRSVVKSRARNWAHVEKDQRHGII